MPYLFIMYHQTYTKDSFKQHRWYECPMWYYYIACFYLLVSCGGSCIYLFSHAHADQLSQFVITCIVLESVLTILIVVTYPIAFAMMKRNGVQLLTGSHHIQQ